MIQELSYGELIHNLLLKYCKNSKHRKVIETLLTVSKDVNYGQILNECITQGLENNDIDNETAKKVSFTILNGNEQLINAFRKSVNETHAIKVVDELTLDIELYQKNSKNYHYLKNNSLVSFINTNRDTIVNEVVTYFRIVAQKALIDAKKNIINVTTLTLNNINEVNVMYSINVNDFDKLNNNVKTTILNNHAFVITNDTYKIMSYVKVPMLLSFDYFDIIKNGNKTEPQKIDVDTVYISYGKEPLFKLNILIDVEDPAESTKEEKVKNKKKISKYISYTYSCLDDSIIALHYALYRNGLLSTNIWSPAKLKIDG